MRELKTRSLYDSEKSNAFYEDRFKHGYMEYWPPEVKKRICEVIGELKLPKSGEALDFGCGSGILTDVLRKALPGWKVYGCDISKIAIENARRSFGECEFFVVGDDKFKKKQYDFLFTNHVLEHVHDLDEVVTQISNQVRLTGSMLHVLPCGNPGSFEQIVCELHENGVDPTLENRFFFEDEGHVRRLTTLQLVALFQMQGFYLGHEYYRNQYYGAIDWITASGTAFVKKFTDGSKAKNSSSKRRLRQLRFQLMWLASMRAPVKILSLYLKSQSRKRYIILPLLTPVYPFAKLLDEYLKQRAEQEWRDHRQERNGSEMYLFFGRK